MSPNRRIFLNIVATYGRSLYALVCGLFISRWVLAALGKTSFGLYGVVGGMMVFALLAFTMRSVRGRNAMVSLSMGSDPMEAPKDVNAFAKMTQGTPMGTLHELNVHFRGV